MTDSKNGFSLIIVLIISAILLTIMGYTTHIASLYQSQVSSIFWKKKARYVSLSTYVIAPQEWAQIPLISRTDDRQNLYQRRHLFYKAVVQLDTELFIVRDPLFLYGIAITDKGKAITRWSYDSHSPSEIRLSNEEHFW